MTASPRRVLRGLLPAGLVVFLLGLAALRVQECVRFGDFHADGLFVFNVCQVCHQRGLDPAEWYLPPAAYVFPEMVVTYLACFLTSDAVRAFLLYSFFHYLALGAIVVWTCRLMGLRGREALTTGLAAAVAVAAVGFRFPGLGLQPSCHAGTMLVGVLLIPLTLRLCLAPGRLSAPLLALVAGLGIYSDPLLIVQAVGPLGAACLLLAVVGRLPRRRAVLALLCYGAGAALAWGLGYATARAGVELLSLNTCFSPKQRWANAVKFFAFVVGDALSRELALYALIFLVVSLLCWARRRWLPFAPENAPASDGPAARSARQFVWLSLALSLACTPGGVLWTGIWSVPPHMRYFQNFCVVPPLGIILFLRLQLPRGGLLGQGAALAALAAALVCGAGPAALVPTATGGVTSPTNSGSAGPASGLALSTLRLPYPPLAETLDRLARERGCRFGLSGYWRAKEVTYSSREGVVVNPAVNGVPWMHNHHPDQFLDPDFNSLAIPRYTFVVVTANDPWTDPRQIRQQYGEPEEKVRVGPHEIWLYDRLHNGMFTRFLEARLAARLRRLRPYRAPSSPRALARPKLDVALAHVRGVVSVPPGGELEVRFPGPTTGRLIDLSAFHLDRYEMTFCRGATRLGSVLVPAVPCPGIGYADPGLCSRLIAVPAALRSRPWDRIVLRPLAGQPISTVGHLLVFDEEVAGLVELKERDDLLLGDDRTAVVHLGFHEGLRGRDFSSPPITLGRTFTVEAIVRPSTRPRPDATVLSNHGGYLGLTLERVGGGKEFTATLGGGTGDRELGRLTLQEGAWNYVAIVRGDQEARVYHNGRPITCVAGDVTFSNSPLPLVIGNGNGGDRPFDGEIAEVRVLGHALTEAEVRRNAAVIGERLR
jgi:hypothetical protein